MSAQADDLLDAVTMAARNLADAWGPTGGRLFPPACDSQASRELQLSADKRGLEATLARGAFELTSSAEHLRCLVLLLDQPDRPATTPFTVARGGIEAAAFAAWLLDPCVSAHERAERGARSAEYDRAVEKQLLGGKRPDSDLREGTTLLTERLFGERHTYTLLSNLTHPGNHSVKVMLAFDVGTQAVQGSGIMAAWVLGTLLCGVVKSTKRAAELFGKLTPPLGELLADADRATGLIREARNAAEPSPGTG